MAGYIFIDGVLFIYYIQTVFDEIFVEFGILYQGFKRILERIPIFGWNSNTAARGLYNTWKSSPFEHNDWSTTGHGFDCHHTKSLSNRWHQEYVCCIQG